MQTGAWIKYDPPDVVLDKYEMSNGYFCSLICAVVGRCKGSIQCVVRYSDTSFLCTFKSIFTYLNVLTSVMTFVVIKNNLQMIQLMRRILWMHQNQQMMYKAKRKKMLKQLKKYCVIVLVEKEVCLCHLYSNVCDVWPVPL